MLPRTLDIASLFPSSASDHHRWRGLVEADLKGAPFERKLVTHTYEGIYIQPLYTASDPSATADVSGFSGLMPMTRGARVLGVSQRGWDLRQERSEADPDAANAAVRDDLEGGATSVVIRFDACARSGRDPLDPMGAQLAGRDGIAAYTVDDLDRVLDGVHLEMVSIGLESGAAFMPAAALLAGLWERRGVPSMKARGAFQADPLAVLARDGSLPYCLEEGLSAMADLAAWTSQRYPGVRAIRVGTAAYHHAGATATQDLAFSMATALEYLRAMTRSGLSVDAAAGQMLFSYAVGCNMFLAMAKLRAARRVWARVVEACSGSEEARRMSMYIRPSKRVLTMRDPWVNILRNTACVFAGAMGGADAICSTPYDAPLGEPSARARRLARNTHHLLMEECRLHAVCDMPGGSWYIEKLTDELCEKAWVILQAIEKRGGMIRALTDGWISRQIDDASQPRLRNIATRKDVIVGVSDFPDSSLSERSAAPVDRDRLVAAACSRLRRRSGSFLDTIAPAEAMLGARAEWCVEQALGGASIGEIASLLGPSLGAPAMLQSAIHVHPYAEPFERLRESVDAFTEESGSPPRVFLAVLGPAAQRLARVNYCINLFEAGGFEVIGAEGDGTVESAVRDFGASGAHIAVVCGPDEEYASAVPRLAPALHRIGARRVVVAGNPGASESAFRAAGVDHFVFIRCDVVELLRTLLLEEGVML